MFSTLNMLESPTGNWAYRTNNGNPERPIVLLHGLNSSSRIYHDQLTDNRFSEYNLIAIDLPGHGDTKISLEKINLHEISTALNWAISKLTDASPVVIGNSLGGHIAMQGLPELSPAGLMIFGSPPISLPIDIASLFHPQPFLQHMYEESYSQEVKEIWLESTFSKPEDVGDFFMEDVNRTDGVFRAAFGQSVAMQDGFRDERQILADTSVPVAMLHGVEEAFVKKSWLQETNVPTLWKDQIIDIPDCNHFPTVENPAYFNPLLLEFAQETLQ